MKKIAYLLVVLALILTTIAVFPISADEPEPPARVGIEIGTASAANFTTGGFTGEGEVQFFKVIPGRTYKIKINKMMFIPIMDDNPAWATEEAIAAGKVANLTDHTLTTTASGTSPRMIIYTATEGVIGDKIAGSDNYSLVTGNAYHIADESVAWTWQNMQDNVDCYDTFEISFTAPEDVSEVGIAFAFADYPAWATTSMTLMVESIKLSRVPVWTEIATGSAANFATGGFKGEGEIQFFDVVPGSEYDIRIDKMMIVPDMDDNPTWKTPEAIEAGKVANLTGIGLNCAASNCSPRLIVYTVSEEGELTGTINNLDNVGLQGEKKYTNWVEEESVPFSWPNMQNRVDGYDTFVIGLSVPKGVTKIGVVFAFGSFPAWAKSMTLKTDGVFLKLTGEHEHEAEDVEEVPATCTESGTTAGKKCAICGEILEGCEEIPALGHTPVEVAEDPATCTKKGLTAGHVCEVCGAVLDGREKTDKIAHNYVNGKCTMCGKDDPDYVPGQETDTAAEQSTKRGCKSMIAAGGAALVPILAIGAFGMVAPEKKKRNKRK